MEVHDTVVAAVIKKFAQRSEFGRKKYGTTLDRTDLGTHDWIVHAQEEFMDGILYLEKLKQSFPAVAVAAPNEIVDGSSGSESSDEHKSESESGGDSNGAPILQPSIFTAAAKRPRDADMSAVEPQNKRTKLANSVETASHTSPMTLVSHKSDSSPVNAFDGYQPIDKFTTPFTQNSYNNKGHS